MHIPDNYLSPATCGVMFALAAPVVGHAIHRVKVELKERQQLAPMLGIAASLSFLIMMFNVPVPGGTTAHAVGGTLLAILIGPDAACLAVTVALILQAFLFGDGGILALGANIFNMAIIMPYTGYGIYRFFTRRGHQTAGVLVGSYFGINLAALLAGIELGLQPLVAHSASGQPLYNPYPLAVTVPAMLLAHLLVAGFIEAGFTGLVYSFVKKAAPGELYQAHQPAPTVPASRRFMKGLYWLIGGLVILSPLGLLAQGTAFGEWSKEELAHRLVGTHLATGLPAGMRHGLDYGAAFSDYQIPGTMLPLGYVLSAVTAILIFVLIGKVLMATNEKANKQ